MLGAAHKTDQEYWQPPGQPASPDAPTEACPRCHADYVMGARFCHVCGAQREAQPEIGSPGIARFLDFQLMRDSLGLPLASLFALIAGVVCVILAAGMGLMYTATTTLDWQAIQLWRIEWLLAAIAAFLAGILLKRLA